MTRIAQLSRATSLLAGLALFGNVAAAQDAGADSRWQAFLGCWEAIQPEGTAPAAAEPNTRICVIPTSDVASVEIATVVGDSIAFRQKIVASGEKRQMTKDGCAGWERAQWSTNGQRVYLRTYYTCPGGLTRSSNGIMGMTSTGEWLDVNGIVAGSTVAVRVVRYRDVTWDASLPAEVAALLKSRGPFASQARIAAMAALTTDDVVDATHFVDPGVVQTWLAERRDGFALDARQIVALEKAGVPTMVIDVMVALSYPNYFALDRSRVAGATRTDDVAQAGEGRIIDLYGWDPFYTYDRYGRYGYGYGGGGWYYGNRPVVIVRQGTGDNEAESHGRVVKGRGYVPGSRRERPSSGASSDRSGSSGSSGSASSGSSGGSSSKQPSSGSGRTAKPKPPSSN
jgi:hypothetical protein